MECALLDGEQESEMAQLQREKELLDELKGKMHSIDKTTNTEKSQVKKVSGTFSQPTSASLVCPSAGYLVKSWK